jgi:hypothetical protein
VSARVGDARLHQAQARRRGPALATGLREFAPDAGGVIVTRAGERPGKRGQFFEVEVVEAGWESDGIVHPATEDGVGSLFAGGGSRFRHRDVNVFEDLAWGDAENAFAGFHEIVALAATVRAAERVRETKRGVELFGFDQKTRAVCLPLDRFHGADPSAAKLQNFEPDANWLARLVRLPSFCLRANVNLRGKWTWVNPIFLVQLRKFLDVDQHSFSRMNVSANTSHHGHQHVCS